MIVSSYDGALMSRDGQDDGWRFDMRLRTRPLHYMDRWRRTGSRNRPGAQPR